MKSERETRYFKLVFSLGNRAFPPVRTGDAGVSSEKNVKVGKSCGNNLY